MNKNRTFLKVKINIPDLNNWVTGSDPTTGTYEAELVMVDKDIQLKVFYPDKEYLGEKIGYWSQDREDNLVKYFEVLEILQPSELSGIDFLDYDYKGFSNSTKYYEAGLKYFILTLSGVKKTYQNVSGNSTEFFLNDSGFSLVERNYHYPVHFPWEEGSYKWEPVNEVKEFVKFDGIEFKPEHIFVSLQKDSNPSVVIEKEPKLTIKHTGISEEDTKRYVSLLCSLYSFYAHEDVNYDVSKIQTEDAYYYEMRDTQRAKKDGHGIFRWDFSQNPLNLIANVNVSHLLENLEFVQNIITRYNYALQTQGESRFMILYNVLEQIRNQYILDKKIEQEKAGEVPNPKKVIEQYKFTHDKKQTNKLITEALESIIEIVDEEHKELFRSEISQKVSGIKIISMNEQFKSFFEYIEIDPAKHELDFKAIKDIRNSIFHGAPVSENEAYLNKINNYKRFPRFVGIVILKFFGINDLSKITKQYR